MVLSNMLGEHLIAYVIQGGVKTLQEVALEGQFCAGAEFIYNGHFYGKGFGASNKGNRVSLQEKLDAPLDGKRLVFEFSKAGLVNATAYSRLSGSTRLFVFGYVAEIDADIIRAIPYAIGDLVERTGALPIAFHVGLQLAPEAMAQFGQMDLTWMPSTSEFKRMRGVPEQIVKELVGELLGEIDVPKDWGGEEADLFSANLSVDGRPCTAAFLLKGPARFHEMTLADCGKNADQIYRLFNIPADVYVIQHCHRIGPAVRKTVEAMALHRSLVAPCRYMFIDGYATARLLRANGRWPDVVS